MNDYRKNISDLEADADRAHLPASKVSLSIPASRGREPVPLEVRLIQEQLRLVALIDRSERSADASALADRAASLLADLNSERSLAFSNETERGKPAFDDLRKSYRKDFATMRVDAERVRAVQAVVDTMVLFRRRYEAVSEKATVPWYFIAVVHNMEASLNFQAHLHNGDVPLSKQTRNVPAGRPSPWSPPKSWAESALDALQFMNYFNAQDWSIERMLYRFENFNGWGYQYKKVPSPYLWSFSNHYKSGKFTKDRVYDANAKSRQVGAAVLLKQFSDRGLISA